MTDVSGTRTDCNPGDVRVLIHREAHSREIAKPQFMKQSHPIMTLRPISLLLSSHSLHNGGSLTLQQHHLSRAVG
jgi:hypothetical protein